MSRALPPLRRRWRALLALGAVVAAAEPARADDAQARQRFLADGDAKALAQSLAASPDPRDREDLALARLAADPAARLEGPVGAAGPLTPAAVVDALRLLDLARARALLASARGSLSGVPGAWLGALVEARGGSDDAAVRRLLEAGRPSAARDAFTLAMIGAALPAEDRALLGAIARLGVVRLSVAGRWDDLPALAGAAVALDVEGGARTLAVAARALRRAGRPDAAEALLSGEGATRVGAKDPLVRLERGLCAWRRGDGAAARAQATGGPPPSVWAWAFEALAKAEGAPATVAASPLPLAEGGADADAAALSRFVSLLGVATTPADVTARAAARETTAGDPAFPGALAADLGLEAVDAAGDPDVARAAAARGLPVLFFKLRRGGDRFVDHPVVLRGYDRATDLFVSDEPDPDVLDVVPGAWLSKGRVLLAAPRARAADLAAARASPAARLGSALVEALGPLSGPAPEKAVERLAGTAATFPGSVVADVYLGYANYVVGLAAKDAARRAVAGSILRRTSATPPVLAVERFVRTMESSVGRDGAVEAAADLADAAKDEGPAAYLATACFLVLENARRHAEAMDSLARARDLDPLDVLTLRFRGSTRRVLGDPSGARDDLVRALDRRPADRGAADDLGNLYLEEGEPEKALAVVRAVAEADPTAAQDRRVRLLRQRAEVKLVRRARSAADLAPLASSPEPVSRMEVAWTAAAFESPEAEGILRALLRDGDEAVRRKAAQSFQRPWLADRLAADASLLQSVGSLLDDPAPAVREAAAQALGQVETAAADALLLARMGGPRKDASTGVRVALVEAVAGRETAPVRRGLVAALSDEETAVRGAAFRALQRLSGAPRGFDPDDPPEKRAAAVRAWERWLEESGR